MGGSSEGPAEEAGAFSSFSTVGQKDFVKRWLTLFTAVGEGRGYTALMVSTGKAQHRAFGLGEGDDLARQCDGRMSNASCYSRFW